MLLIERGKGAPRGTWSFPGGHVEAGERVRDAVRREVLEETGLEIEVGPLIDVHDVILRNAGGGLRAHYVLSVFFARAREGAPVISGGDVMDARFVAFDTLDQYRLTDGARDLIERVRLLG